MFQEHSSRAELRIHHIPTNPSSFRSCKEQLLRWSLIILVNFVLTVGGGEIVVRCFHYQPLQSMRALPAGDATWGQKDPQIGWTNKPGTHTSVEAGHAAMTFWSGGRRATEGTDPDVADSIRTPVVFLGDSWTQAYGVADSDSYGWLIHSQRPEITVENYGTGGHGVLQSWMMLERFYSTNTRAKPPLVIFAFTPFMNARNVPSYERVASLRQSGSDIYFPPFVVKSREGQYQVTEPYSSVAWPLEHSLALFNFLHDAWVRGLLWLRNDTIDVSEVSLHYIERMRDLATRNGAQFLFVWLLKGEFDKSFEERLARMKIETLNCEHPDGFGPQLRVGGNGHPNKDYHRYIASCIVEHLKPTMLAAAPGDKPERAVK